VIQKAVNLQYVAFLDNAILQNAFFQKIHGTHPTLQIDKNIIPPSTYFVKI
jgi:hypothetical protein